ncbi:hypothetical protein [Eubacterium sp.]|uniref:hypothetical protein n=1 Tax=Eubacterium sp. TaxID=142586 RepID=UPI0025DDB029|nr:hypothetical protein [Eubacterium sp.]MCR5628061.1 hypothetical protein [Eubacterium sp.]
MISRIKQYLKDNRALLICFFSALLMMTIYSENSFIYKMNGWADVNAMFNVGRSMLKGKVLYADVFDHKGFYAYIPYILGAVISFNSYVGIYVVEVISYTVFLYFVYKTWNLYVEKNSDVFIPFFAIAINNSLFFYRGGSSEEFTWPFIMIGLYLVLAHTKNETMHKKYIWIVEGILTGLVFWNKFSLSIFFVGITVYVFFYWIGKDWIRIVETALLWLAGLIIASIPVVLYFSITKNLNTMWKVYIVNNIFDYTGSRTSLANIIKFMIPFINYVFIIILLIMIVKKVVDKNTALLSIIYMVSCFIYVIFITGTFVYIYNVFAPLYAICFIGVISFFDKLIKNKKVYNYLVLPIFACVFVLAMNTSFRVKNTSRLSEYDVYTEMAEFMQNDDKEDTDNSLFLLDYYDEGIYVISEQIPSGKYFTKYNLEIDGIDDYKNDFIKNKKCKYIITTDKGEYNENLLKEYYKKEKSISYTHDGYMMEIVCWKKQ